MRRGRGNDHAWTPLALDHGVVVGRVLLTPLGGSEPHRSKPASSGNKRSPILGRALIPAGEQTTVQSWGSGRHSGDRLGTDKLDAKSLPGACEPGVVPTAFPDRLPVLPQGFPESGQQHRHRSGALPDAALGSVVGPRTGNEGHYVLPETGALGNNDESQAIRKARASSTTHGGSFRRRSRHTASRVSTTPRAFFVLERHVLCHRDWPHDLTAPR